MFVILMVKDYINNNNKVILDFFQVSVQYNTLSVALSVGNYINPCTLKLRRKGDITFKVIF